MNIIERNAYKQLHKFIISHTDTSLVVCCAIKTKMKDKNEWRINKRENWIYLVNALLFNWQLQQNIYNFFCLFEVALKVYALDDQSIVRNVWRVFNLHFSLRKWPKCPMSIWRNWRECPSKTQMKTYSCWPHHLCSTWYGHVRLLPEIG